MYEARFGSDVRVDHVDGLRDPLGYLHWKLGGWGAGGLAHPLLEHAVVEQAGDPLLEQVPDPAASR